jgi:peptide-methionine (S)-S-oxide reductase
MVQTGLTGHAEVIQVTFDPEVVSYDKLLTVFWASHDPTSLNRQGPDEGTEYRSIILYHSAKQQQAAQKSYQKVTDAHVFPSPIVTELVPLKAFYPAERYHQNYYRLNGFAEYSQNVIVPKLQMMKYKLDKLSHLDP